MPTLPSGIEIVIAIDHIMEPDKNWAKAPENHFWLWAPAPEEDEPPYAPDKLPICAPEYAPIPKDRDEVTQYVRVYISDSEGKNHWWRGEMLSDFPKYSTLTEADKKAWVDWLSTEQVKEFLDKTIVKCQTQAAINLEATGYTMLEVKTDENGEEYYTKTIDNPLENTH